MLLLLALVLLAAVLGAAVVLGIVAMLRRPFRPPSWQPAPTGVLLLRAVLLASTLAIAVLVATLRHAHALAPLALGLAGGGLLGLGSALTARLQAGRVFVMHRPHRIFVVLVAIAILARSGAGIVAIMAGRDSVGWLPMLGGLLGGYPLVHALALHMRVRRFARLHRTR